VAVSLPYDPRLVQLLKRSVPSTGRSYNPGRASWTVEIYYLDRLLQAFREAGILIRDSRGRLGDPTCPYGAFINLFNAMGPGRSEEVFDALSKVLHPDHPSGDQELMVDLVASRDHVRAQRCASLEAASR
jgi:hypothetical protein